jgi:hypothetical protein
MTRILALMMAGGLATQAQPSHARSGPVPKTRQMQAGAFVVTTIAPSGARVQQIATSWDGASDEDTVLITSPSDTTTPDSILLFVRSGPLKMLDDLPNVTHADSLGTWARATRSLVRPPRTTGRKFGLVVGALLPRAVIEWARTSRRRCPYLTRIAVIMWRRGHATRSELEVFHGV